MSVSFATHRGLLATYLRPQRRRVAGLTVVLLGSIGLQLLGPRIVGLFIDATQSHGPRRGLAAAALLYLVVAIGQRLASLATVYLGKNISWDATNRLRADLTRHCLDLDLQFHKTYTPGTLIERIDGDVTALANFLSEFAIRILGNGVLVLGILVLLYHNSLALGAALTLYVALIVAALRAVQRVAVDAWAAERQASAEQYGYLEERIAGTEDVRANGAEGYVLHRLYGLLRAPLRLARRARLLGNLTNLSTNALSMLGYTLGLALGAALYRRGEVTIGGVYSIVFYVGMLAAPLSNIRQQLQDLQQATASIGRIDELLALRPLVQDAPGSPPLPLGPLAVEFRDVSFGYEAGHVVLHDLSFLLGPGQVLGLLGRTGSGKTTLARLLFRLYDPTSGGIALGTRDLRGLALADLRARVGMVTQDVQLFAASVRDNLTFFRRDLRDERIAQTLDLVGLAGWYRALPLGLDTALGAGGVGLSAGEAQLLALARVFLKDPGLVILDEASSRLDPSTERLLERAVDRLLEGRTGIVIAHRLHTVQRADVIMIIEGGRIVECGPRLQLAADPASLFTRLLQTGLEEMLA